MSDGGSGMCNESGKSVTRRSSCSSDDIYKALGEIIPVLKKKSLVPLVDKGDVRQKEPSVITSDMPDEMQKFAIDCAMKAITRDKFANEKEVASYIRRKMEERYNPNWHCIVGRTFGSFVSHESKHYIHFSVGKLGILVFKSG